MSGKMLKQNAVRRKNAKLKCHIFSTLQNREIKMQRKISVLRYLFVCVCVLVCPALHVLLTALQHLAHSSSLTLYAFQFHTPVCPRGNWAFSWSSYEWMFFVASVWNLRAARPSHAILSQDCFSVRNCRSHLCCFYIFILFFYSECFRYLSLAAQYNWRCLNSWYRNVYVDN